MMAIMFPPREIRPMLPPPPQHLGLLISLILTDLMVKNESPSLVQVLLMASPNL